MKDKGKIATGERRTWLKLARKRGLKVKIKII
jgi:hypothetical protein